MADPKPSTSAPISQFTGANGNTTGVHGIAWRPSSNTFLVTKTIGGGLYRIYEYTPAGALVTDWPTERAEDATSARDDDIYLWVTSSSLIKKWNVVTKAKVAEWSITGMSLTLSTWRGVAWLAGDYYYAYYRSSSPTTHRLCKVAKSTNAVVAEVEWTAVTGHTTYGIEAVGSTVYWISNNGDANNPETAVSLYSAVDLAFQETIILHSTVGRCLGIAYNDEHFWVREYSGVVFEIGTASGAGGRPRRWVCII